ncbi:MAG: hypothetical protein ACRDXB_02960, partial [Actinomycetes bacterium]
MGSGGGTNGAGGPGGQSGTEDGSWFGSYLKQVGESGPQQPDGQVVKNKDPRTGTDPPAGATTAPFPNALPRKPQPGQPGTGSQDCAAGGCATSPVPGVKTPDADTSAETAGLTGEQKAQYDVGLTVAQDRNAFTSLVPGYDPAVAPTRDQIIQAGAETRRLNQEVRDANGSGEDPGAAQRLVPRVPDTHEFFGRLSEVPAPQIGTAAAITNAWAY